MNLVKKAILEFAVAEKKKKEDEESQRKKSEESKRNAEKSESDELLRQHQEQAVVRLVDELMKVNSNLKDELYNKNKFNVSGDSIGQILSHLKSKPFGFNKFAMIKASLESFMESEIKEKADSEDALKQAKLAEKQAKIQERKDRMREKREKLK